MKEPEDKSAGVLLARGWVADYADANTFAEIWPSDSTEIQAAIPTVNTMH